MRKLMLPIQGDFIAQRFDLATEIVIVRFENGRPLAEPKTIIMEKPSDEELCGSSEENAIIACVFLHQTESGRQSHESSQ